MKNAILVFILIGLIALAGCNQLVIEKKKLLVSVLPDSNEVNLYYVYEGISLRDKNKWSVSDISALRRSDFSFLPSGSRTALELCKFERLRFFVDPDRKRQLCADRRMTIRDRSKFAEVANRACNEAIIKATMDLDESAIKNLLKENRDKWVKNRPAFEAFFPTPSLQYITGLLEISEQYDVDSIKQIVDAAHADFRWFRFESYSFRIVLPATAECARRIATAPSSIEWLKSMRSDVSPIALIESDEGLVIVLGSKDKVICLNYTDNGRYDPAGETRILQLAQNPGPIIFNGKAESTDSLADKFVFESTGFRTWNDVSGKFQVIAKCGGLVAGKVILEKEDGSTVSVTQEQLGEIDRSYLDTIKR